MHTPSARLPVKQHSFKSLSHSSAWKTLSYAKGKAMHFKFVHTDMPWQAQAT